MEPAKQVESGPIFRPARELWSSTIAALMVAFYFVTTLWIASRRPFWFDEVVTVLFARLPSIGILWKAVRHIDPWVPVPTYFVVHFVQKVFGAGQLAVRLPSAIAFAVGLLITFDCARRLANGLHGLIAVSLLSCTFLPYYGYEARFYGLYFMLSALILWLWANTGNSAAWIVVFGAVFFLCSAVHSYGVLCLLPYALSDILSRRPWWRPSPKVIAGAVGIVVDAGALFFQVAATRKVSGGFPGPHPSFAGLQQIYAEMFPAGLFLLALIAIWIALFPVTGKSTALPAMQSPERVGWLCLSIPIAGLVLATAVTHAFSPRYFIGMLPGVAVAFACALWRHFNRVPALAFGIFALLGGVGVARQIQVIRHPESIDIYGQQTQTREFLRREGDIWKDGKQFILWSGNFLYLPAHYYSHHQDQYVFLQPDDEGLRALLTIPLGFTQYYPYRVWTTKDLIRHARETAVIHPRPATLKALQDAGFQVEIRYSDPIQIVYLK